MKINKVIENKICLGCGLCKSCYPDKCDMVITEEGFYNPSFNTPLTKSEDKVLSELCPSIHVEDSDPNDKGYWGHVIEVAEAWSGDNDIRFHSASGGVTTSLAIYLLENNLVDGILQVGLKENDWLHNELKVSTSVKDIKDCAQSRYAPALTLNRIHEFLSKDTSKKYAFIGKPCDIAAIRNLQRNDSSFSNQIVICISIFCAGMPSYNATETAWKKSGREDSPCELRYRGEGWPGDFCAKWEDSTEFKMSYNDSWGKILGRSCGLRCKVCPDGIGELADIAIGDAWHTKNGYPDFTDADGRCFVMVRTQKGKEVFDQSIKAGAIISKTMNISDISSMQPYQTQRRKDNLWRLLPLEIKTMGLLDFKGMKVVSMGIKESPVKAIKTLIGSCRRILKS